MFPEELRWWVCYQSLCFCCFKALVVLHHRHVLLRHFMILLHPLRSNSCETVSWNARKIKIIIIMVIIWLRNLPFLCVELALCLLDQRGGKNHSKHNVGNFFYLINHFLKGLAMIICYVFTFFCFPSYFQNMMKAPFTHSTVDFFLRWPNSKEKCTFSKMVSWNERKNTSHRIIARKRNYSGNCLSWEMVSSNNMALYCTPLSPL